jgi:hypothetical protein
MATWHTRDGGRVFTLIRESVSQRKTTCTRIGIVRMHGAGPSTQGGRFSVNRKVWIFSVVSTVVAMLMASVAVAFAAQDEGGQGQESMTVCHKGHTITVATPAVAAHERHGDTEGACPAEDAGTPEDTEGTTPDTTTPDTTTPDTAADDQYGQEKVMLCHKGHTITVARPAVAAHERHGDIEGACPAEDSSGDGVADEGQEGIVSGPAEGRDLYGDSTANTMRGTLHADFLQSGRGPDVVFGGVGNDFIDGVDGISGNDELDGGRGIDHCVGDEGDTFRYCNGNVVEVPSGTQSAK